MVYFVCNKCQETLKLKAIAGHWCNSTFDCVDCSKSFTAAECRTHNTCISEAEKYQGALYRGPKGKKVDPQEAWTAQVASAASKAVKHRVFMERLLGYGNVPRKLKPFINFAKNSIGVRDDRVLQEMFEMIQAENPRPAPGAAAAGAASGGDAAEAPSTGAGATATAPAHAAPAAATGGAGTSSSTSAAAPAASSDSSVSGKKRKRVEDEKEEEAKGDEGKEEETAAAAGGKKEKKDKKEKKEKKEKKAKAGEEAEAEEDVAAPPSAKKARSAFKMKETIVSELTGQPGGKMKLKRLRKAVVDAAVHKEAYPGGEEEADDAFDAALAKLEKRYKVVADGTRKFVQVVADDVAEATRKMMGGGGDDE